MYVYGLGAIPELGLGENGPTALFVSYSEVNKKIDSYVKSTREPISKQFISYVQAENPNEQEDDAPKDLYEVSQRVKTIIDRNGPPLAGALMVQEYLASAKEGPADISELPSIVGR